MNIELPDGRVIGIPDGVDMAQVEAALAAEFTAPEPNADGTYGDVPDGYFIDPETGSYTSRENIKNHLQQHTDAGTEHARTRADAFSAGAANGISLGWSDEIADKFGIPAEKTRAYMEHDYENHPGAFLTGEIGAAMSLPVKGPQGATATERAVNTARQAGRFGAVYGAGSGEGDFKDRIPDMARGAMWGAGAGGALSVGGDGVRKMLERNMQKAAIRKGAAGADSTEELLRKGSQAYDDVDRAGVQIKASAFDKARGDIDAALKAGTAYSTRPGGKVITPNTRAVMDDMADMSDEMAQFAGQNPAVPFKEVDHLRRQAGAAAGNVANKSDQKAGMTVIEGLDDLVQNLSPADVAAGDADALKTALPKARDLWSRMSKSQMVDDAIASTGNYLSGDASAIRNQFARILRNPKLSRGFTEAEIAAMKNVVHPGMIQQMLNYAGSGLGMMGQVGLGMAAGPVGTAVGLAGAAGSRKLSEAITAKNAEIVRALVANGRLKALPQIDRNKAKVVEALIGRGAVAGQN